MFEKVETKIDQIQKTKNKESPKLKQKTKSCLQKLKLETFEPLISVGSSVVNLTFTFTFTQDHHHVI